MLLVEDDSYVSVSMLNAMLEQQWEFYKDQIHQQQSKKNKVQHLLKKKLGLDSDSIQIEPAHARREWTSQTDCDQITKI